MNAKRSLFAAIPLLVLLSWPVLASERTLSLDPNQTEIGFELKATGHDVHGLFKLTAGEFGFDPETHRAWGQLEIDVHEADTGSAKRDKTMHNKVLDSDHFPLVLFRPDHIEGDIALEGESDFDLVGTVTMLGVEHPLSLPTHAVVHDGTVEATTTFPVPFVEWGLHDPSFFMLKVAKIVDVTVHTVGSLDSQSPAATGGSQD